MLFSDVTGFTPLSERLDPEALHLVMEDYYAAMRSVVERHGGHIERYIGDCVLAVFGLPAARENDALRALRAAAEINGALEAVTSTLPEGLEVELLASTGVNTGEIFVDEALALHAGELLGDAVNVGARLEGVAAPREVLLGERTYRLVRDRIDAERLELALKGKSQTVTAFRLIRLLTPGPKPDRRLSARTVGRAQEAAQLAQAFAQAAYENRCVLATVTGLAGKGKSRLIADALTSVKESARILSGRCLPYGEATIYWPLAEIACQAAGITQEEEPQAAIVAIAKLLSPDPDPTQRATAERLAGTFGLGPLAGAAEEIAPDVVTLMRALASARPLVVVVEDIHWAAPDLLAALEHTAARLDDAPLLLLCSARPELSERRPTWPGDAPATHTISLGPLCDEDCAALIAELLEGSSAAAELTAPVLAVAGGNPLVVEEVLTMLIDDGVLAQTAEGWLLQREVQEIHIPPTIEAILSARLDRLTEPERDVIEGAAVIGKEFDLAEVRALADLNGQSLAEQIGALLDKQLIQPAVGTLSDYRFHHILVRDAAYAATPKRRRAELHERFASHLERYPAGQRGGAYNEIVGEHLERSCLLRRELGAADAEVGELAHHAGELLEEAGRRAVELSDFVAAHRIYARGEAVLARNDPLRAELQTELAEATFAFCFPRETQARAGEAVALAQLFGDDTVRARAALIRARADVWCDDRPLEEVLTEVREIACNLENSADDRSVIWAWMTISFLTFFGALFAEGYAAGSRAVARARRSVPAQLPYCLAGMCRSLSRSPIATVEARNHCEHALSLVQPDTIHATMIESELAFIDGMSGHFESARGRFERVGTVSEEYRADAWLHASLQDSGMCELLARDFERAERDLRRSRELAGSIDDLFAAGSAALHARALARLGRHEDALAEAETAQERVPTNDIESQVWWRVASALALCGLGDLHKAEPTAHDAAAMARLTEAPLLLGDALSVYGEVLLAQGRAAEAEAALQEAIGVYQAKGIAPAVTGTRELL